MSLLTELLLVWWLAGYKHFAALRLFNQLLSYSNGNKAAGIAGRTPLVVGHLSDTPGGVNPCAAS